MANPTNVAHRHYNRRRRLIRALTTEANRLWRTVDLVDLDAWYYQHGRRLMVLLAAAQIAAARQADDYLDNILRAQDLDPEPVGRVVPEALAGVASDGRPLEGLMAAPPIAVKESIASGSTMSRALAAGQATLGMILSTQVADTGRVADGMALTARRGVGGYVRMLSPPSCSRCAVLAGKWFRWNRGFDRHPRCDCTHIPANEDTSGDLRTDPDAYFASLSKTEQDRIFTNAGARAIRDGADLGQVVNARRGMTTTVKGRQTTERVFGRDVLITREGITVRGIAGRRLGADTGLTRRAGTRYRESKGVRLMPEQIYLDATSREDAIRLLRRFGYLT